MQFSSTPPKNIVIVAHPSMPGAPEEALKVEAALNSAGIASASWASMSDETLRQRLAQGEFEILIALGGDGTMLRAGRLGGPFGVPVLGINLGRFGFLTELKRDGWATYIPELAAGRFRVEERMMIRATMWWFAAGGLCAPSRSWQVSTATNWRAILQTA